MRANRAILPVEQMAQNMADEVANGKRSKDIYKIQAEEFKKAELEKDIGRALNALSEPDAERVDFSNVEDVRRRIVDYFKACQIASVYPSVQGLASFGFGISRQALNQWRQRDKNRHTEAAALIERACDMMADILTNQSLHNNANPVQSLFQMKNNHSFADKIEIQPVIDDVKREDEFSADDIRRRYTLDEGL